MEAFDMCAALTSFKKDSSKKTTWLASHKMKDWLPLLFDLIGMGQNMQEQEAMELLLQETKPRSMKEANAAGLLADVFNRMPRWRCKGHPSEAMFSAHCQTLWAETLPGRHAPCPCGSGKTCKQRCGLRVN